MLHGNELSPKELNKHGLTLELGESQNPAIPAHTHTVLLTPENLEQLYNNKRVRVQTSTVEGHSHSIVVDHYFEQGAEKYRYANCDGKYVCSDRHPKILKFDPFKSI